MIIIQKVIEESLRRYPGDGYLRYHARRYSDILCLLEKKYVKGWRVLDIGRSKLTEIVNEYFGCKVDTLGLESDGTVPSGKNYRFDLNKTQNQQDWRNDIGAYDIIIFTEVIEHIYTSPKIVLSFLHSIMTHSGYLILQTPNAVALHKRIQMLLGNNPFEKIRENNTNPGHYREYTKKEIFDYATATGFAVDIFCYGNYFDYRYISHVNNDCQKNNYLALINYFYSILPGSLKPGLTFVLKKI